MVTIAILVVSLGLQVLAALLALRLAWITERASAWAAIATALALMAARRGVTLGQLVGGTVTLDPVAETIALAISVVMVAGVAGIAPRFRAHSEAAAELARASQLVDALVAQAPLAIVVTGRDGAVHLWNPAAERLFGWSQAEVLGRSLPTLVEGADAPERAPLEGRSVRGAQVRWLRRDGQPLSLRLDATPLGAVLPTGDGVLLLAADLSEVEALERQLQHAQRLELVGRLAGGVAHDFNNLLTVISGNAELMRMQSKSPRVVEHVEQILYASDRAAMLTRQLLAFSRRQVVQPRVIDLNRLVGETRPLLARLIGDDIRLELRLAPAPLPVRADPLQLQQVLVNLVVNARDATTGAGRIVLATDADEPGSVGVCVQDEGVGMDETVQAHLFEAFYTTKEPGRGTGLGLSTVAMIIEQSGGAISVVSAAGRGSTFTVRLPLVDAAVEADREPSGARALRHADATVLVVEDEPGVLVLATDVLRQVGYRVLAASSAEEALDMVERSPDRIDLLVTDVVLPRMSGHDLAARLCERRRDLRVLFTSGYADSVLARHGIVPTDFALLQKPYTVSALTETVQGVLDEAAAAG